MCGISGFSGDFPENFLHKMNDIMVHRGPDDSGIYCNKNTGLAHRRLSIIDLAGGRQPMSNEDDSIWITYNGEVYNFQKLRKKYLSSHTFKTRSDTEVILHLYEEFGEKCIDHLRGMFAFAIWDEKKRKLFIARDRFGIKPLYYAQTSRGFIFASELKALLETDSLARKVDKEALNLYLTFRYVPGSRTMIDAIKKLEPGHYLVYQDGKITITQYWDLNFQKDENQTEQDCSRALTDILREAIDLRLISEVPLGAYLSGGLDSSFMVGLMSQLMRKPVKTFTAGFEDGWHDESPYAATVAEKFATDHRLLRTNPDAVSVLEKVVWHLDEPLGDAATIPTFLLSKLTRKYVTVILSGEGADELFAGYDKYKVLYYSDKYSSLFCSPLFSFLGRLFANNIKLQRGFDLLASQKETAQTYLNLVSVFSEQEKAELFGQELTGLKSAADAPLKLVEKYLQYGEKKGDYLDRLMYLDIKTWLPNDVLLKNDKMTMAHSLEARVPFLDHKFAEYVMTIPTRLKLKGLSEKYILRKAMQGLVPKSITKRRKHGFTVPLAQWMQGELRKVVDTLFSPERIREKGFWNYQAIEKLRQKDLANPFYRRQFWTMVSFELWHRIFIEDERPV